VDDALASALIDRDWAPFLAQVRRLGLGEPRRTDTRIDIPARPPKSEDELLAVLFCDGYDAQAPMLDFADPEDSSKVGGAYWPRIEGAPMNSIQWNGRTVPIICTPGTRGYHLHQSHVAEQHPSETWRLARVAGLLSRFLRMGPYGGRGL
jgi:hypothetical protein